MRNTQALESVRRQRVQSLIRRLSPFTTTMTFCKLGKNLVGVDFLEWLTLRPNMPSLPHFSHFADILRPISFDEASTLG